MKRFISFSITAGLGRALLELDQHRDVGRLEQAERDHRHHADDDEARDDPAVFRRRRSGSSRDWSASCQPAASVIVTTVGMITTIFGISLVVNSIRAGIDIEPMIGPSTKPRNRSRIVHAAPPATWKNRRSPTWIASRSRRSRRRLARRRYQQPDPGDDVELRESRARAGESPRAPRVPRERYVSHDVRSLTIPALNAATVGALTACRACVRANGGNGAEGAGFEPAVRGYRTPVFKTVVDYWRPMKVKGPAPLFLGDDGSGAVRAEP